MEEKIAFCTYYLAFPRWWFICNRFKDFVRVELKLSGRETGDNGVSEKECKTRFPELHEMIMKVGRESYKKDNGLRFFYGSSWSISDPNGDSLLEYEKRRKYKRYSNITELKAELEIKQRRKLNE